MQTQQLVEGYVYRSLDASSTIRPREAIEGLLKGRSFYSSLSFSTVVPCQIVQVALPKHIQSGVFLEEMLPEPDSNMLAWFEKHMLRDASEVGILNEALRTPNSCMDAKLKRSGRAYGKFILACSTSGLVDFSLVAYSAQGVFFVKKKEGKQRYILDCRRANRYLRRPQEPTSSQGNDLATWKSGIRISFNQGWELFLTRPIWMLAFTG